MYLPTAFNPLTTTMDEIPPPDMPNQVGLADSFQLLGNSPIFTDTAISTKLNKLDEFTNTVDKLQENMAQSDRQVLIDEMKSFRDDLEAVKEDLRSTKDDLTNKIDALEKHLKFWIDIRYTTGCFRFGEKKNKAN
ncbi:hypothetical protein O1611_g3976 [Lasiodiplodia mahajangana]|uniref:Uncharacterized protein n=1 Tax=Lasiodiplodia mahajangana TaxID=1108764 RepID=A0ACC2JQD2_9PEZI|nr:hypothetical protein O1611_g3976 [Lasiodiplodia mahajangana]